MSLNPPVLARFSAHFPITNRLPVRLTLKQAKTRFLPPEFRKINQIGGHMASKRMSKTEFVEAIASHSGLEKKQVNAVLEVSTR